MASKRRKLYEEPDIEGDEGSYLRFSTSDENSVSTLCDDSRASECDDVGGVQSMMPTSSWRELLIDDGDDGRPRQPRSCEACCAAVVTSFMIDFSAHYPPTGFWYVHPVDATGTSQPREMWSQEEPLNPCRCIVCIPNGIDSAPVRKSRRLTVRRPSACTCSGELTGKRMVINLAACLYWKSVDALTRGVSQDVCRAEFRPDRDTLAPRRRPILSACVRGCINPHHYVVKRRGGMIGD